MPSTSLLFESNDVIKVFNGVNESSRRLLLKEFVVDDLGLLMIDFLLLDEVLLVELYKLLDKLEMLVLLLLLALLLLQPEALVVEQDGV